VSFDNGPAAHSILLPKDPGPDSPQRSTEAFLPSNTEAAIPYPGAKAINVWIFIVAVPAVVATVLAVGACIAAFRADEFTAVPLSPAAVQLIAGE
jgi:hypothetical protein